MILGMGKIKVTITLSPELLARIDESAREQSRSAAIESLLRQALVERAWVEYARALEPQEASLTREVADESEEATARALEADER